MNTWLANASGHRCAAPDEPKKVGATNFCCCSGATRDSHIQSHHQSSRAAIPALSAPSTTVPIKTQQSTIHSTECICLTASPPQQNIHFRAKDKDCYFYSLSKVLYTESHRTLYNNYSSLSVFSISFPTSSFISKSVTAYSPCGP